MISQVLYIVGVILIIVGVLALLGLFAIGVPPVTAIVVGAILVVVAYFLSRPRSAV